jgi:anthranilate synthase/aminodeoxychorismate synthase-like glutamine amidotransferase
MILLIDNYDSFVENLARYLRRLGHPTKTVRNDEVTTEQVLAWQPDAIVLSPGPCTPNEAGCSLDVVRVAAGKIPLLGVCLGHQTIGAAFGGRVVRAPAPVHGRASPILHNGEGIFAGLPSPYKAGRYHSLVVDEPSLPRELEVTARTSDGIVMGLAHRDWSVYGVQFHPESILTEGGYQLLANFLRLAGMNVSVELPGVDDERPPVPETAALPAGPVTF